MIAAKDLRLSRGGRVVLDAVSLTLDPGAMTVVVGPNGAGKSTLVKLLCGELAPASGTVSVSGRPLADWPPAALARRRAVLPQASTLAFPFTVHEVVRLGAVAGGSRRPDAVAAEALAAVGLAGWGGRSCPRLSGGEQQRVQMARVLAQVPVPADADGPRALFLDEPTSSLDLAQQIAVLDLARRFARAGGAVLAVLHDLNLAAEYADRLVVMQAGRLIASGPPTPALFERIVGEVYGLPGAATRLPPDGMPFVLPQARRRVAAA